MVSLVFPSGTIIEGGVYNISCEVSGDPLPNVTWINFSNNQRIDGNILNFTNIDRNDAGEITDVKQKIDVELILRPKLLMYSVSTVSCFFTY